MWLKVGGRTLGAPKPIFKVEKPQCSSVPIKDTFLGMIVIISIIAHARLVAEQRLIKTYLRLLPTPQLMGF
jgi:hypothetical protein